MKTWSRERPSAEQSKRIEQMVDHVAPERKKERETEKAVTFAPDAFQVPVQSSEDWLYFLH